MADGHDETDESRGLAGVADPSGDAAGGEPGIEVLGAFPPEVRGDVVMVAGIGQRASEPVAARALITFVASDSTLPVIKAKGMERD